MILRLPEGYDTLVCADGAGLSGGQRQRIALGARAARRTEAVVLDEPDAQLDGERGGRRSALKARRGAVVNGRTGQHRKIAVCIEGVAAGLGWAGCDEIAVMPKVRCGGDPRRRRHGAAWRARHVPLRSSERGTTMPGERAAGCRGRGGGRARRSAVAPAGWRAGRRPARPMARTGAARPSAAGRVTAARRAGQGARAAGGAVVRRRARRGCKLGARRAAGARQRCYVRSPGPRGPQCPPPPSPPTPPPPRRHARPEADSQAGGPAPRQAPAASRHASRANAAVFVAARQGSANRSRCCSSGPAVAQVTGVKSRSTRRQHRARCRRRVADQRARRARFVICTR